MIKYSKIMVKNRKIFSQDCLKRYFIYLFLDSYEKNEGY